MIGGAAGRRRGGGGAVEATVRAARATVADDGSDSGGGENRGAGTGTRTGASAGAPGWGTTAAAGTGVGYGRLRRQQGGERRCASSEGANGGGAEHGGQRQVWRRGQGLAARQRHNGTSPAARPLVHRERRIDGRSHPQRSGAVDARAARRVRREGGQVYRIVGHGSGPGAAARADRPPRPAAGEQRIGHHGGLLLTARTAGRR